VAEAVREEYKAIADAGLIVQIDEPEFATAWQFYPDMTVQEYRQYTERRVGGDRPRVTRAAGRARAVPRLLRERP
jgi:hypothetical protein